MTELLEMKENEAFDAELEDCTEETQQESKHDKFLRLSLSRIQKADKSIAMLAGLASKSSYEYTPEEVEKMFGHLQKTLNETKEKFIEKPVEVFTW